MKCRSLEIIHYWHATLLFSQVIKIGDCTETMRLPNESGPTECNMMIIDCHGGSFSRTVQFGNVKSLTSNRLRVDRTEETMVTMVDS